MALRKQTALISSDSQQMDENTQDEDSATDRDTGDEFSSLLLSASSTRGRRRRERENKVKHKSGNSEMTEEEMMDLALRLSEREASVSALRQQQEEEAVMKAIQESMVGQTQPCLSSQSKTLLADASLRLASRRKLLYSNGVSGVCAADQGRPEDCRATESRLRSEANGEEKIPWSRKRKRKAGSPLLEMPELSQGSPCSSEPLSAPLDSPQSSDSTQIDDSQLQKSPVFPLSDCRAAVHINRLNRGLVESCRSSGFVLCSQDSWTLTEPRSPTFPQSNPRSRPKSPVFPGSERVDSGQVEHEMPQSACRRHRSENTDFLFSSQESLSPSVRSHGSRSPVFPKSLDPGDPEGRHEPSASPVFGKTASERRGCECEETPDSKQKTKSDACQVDELIPPKAEKLVEKSEDSAEPELTSDMTLIWTDEEEDDDNTLDGSPSPVFPEEKTFVEADGRPASLTLQDQTRSERRKLLPTTEEETRPVGRRGEDCEASLSPGESPGGPTVHYYWGVPFCPRGLDPDSYTQVILAQMQVYQTSLKQAQRGLLRKAEWGEAIQPQPEKSPSPEASVKSPQLQVPRRKGLRLRGRKLPEAAESPPTEEEERKEEEDEEQEKEEEEKDDEDQMDTDDCDVCPETQLSNDDTQEQTDAEAEPPPEHPEPPEVEMILQLDSPVREEPHKEEEEEEEAVVEAKGNVSGCGGDAGSQAGGEETEATEDGGGPDTERRRSRGLQRSPELEPAVVPRSPDTSVDCPICQASFPASEIELHAAYCDGEVAVVGERRPDGERFHGDGGSVKLPRRRTRRPERTAVGINDSSDVCSNQEKCYVCQKAVPLREYTRHTESCIESRTRHKDNLLSALERTESRDSDAGPSGSKVQPDDVIDLRDDDDDYEEEEAASAFRISDSPIRSFTSISEATGCLVDFKKHHRAKKPSQRRR